MAQHKWQNKKREKPTSFVRLGQKKLPRAAHTCPCGERGGDLPIFLFKSICGKGCNMEILKIMAERIRGLREQSGLTQKNMAELLKCTTSHYQKIEYGKVNIPTTTLAFLADYFEVSADYLLGRTDEP